jgi:ADP-heptose:LPS heptosyltransferase
MQPSKILVIRFSSIGDIVLTTPVFRCLKQQTGAVVHFLTKPSFKSLLAENPHIDKVLTYTDHKETLSLLKTENYSSIIDLQSNIKSRRLTRALGISHQRVDKLNIKKWLLVNTKINTLPSLHIVDRYLAAVASHGITNDGKGLDFYLPAHSDALFQTLKQEHALPYTYIVMAVGAAHATKQIPPHKLSDAINSLPNHTFVLLGGKGEEVLSQVILAKATQNTKVIDLVGKLSLTQSALVIQSAQAILTPDTGLMHIAAALKTPIVSVWGNTVPEFGMFPYRPDAPDSYSIVENKELGCRPCSKLGHAKCPKGHFKCMESLSPQDLVEKIQGYID